MLNECLLRYKIEPPKTLSYNRLELSHEGCLTFRERTI